MADHRVGGVEDGLGGAIVLLEQDGRGVGEVLLEVEDVADVGPTEGIDRLVGVAHHHQLGRLDPLGAPRPSAVETVLGVVGTQLVDQGVLRVVGVLVLVDEHMAEPAPIALLDLGNAWNRCTVIMIRSSKSRALASRSRR